MRFLHTADLHLGRSFPFTDSALRAVGKRDRFETFRNILRRADRYEAEYVFLVGDIFEQKKIGREEVDFALAEMANCSATILLLLGNHDFTLYPYLTERVPENVYLFNQEGSDVFTDERHRIDFHGVSWSRDSHHKILEIDPAGLREGFRHVLLHHGNWTGGDGYFPVDANILPYFDYIALGHVHKPILYENKLQMCGTPEPLDHTDRGRLGIVCGALTDHLETEYISLARRSVIGENFHRRGDADDEVILRRVREFSDDGTRIYTIAITGAYSGVFDAAIRATLEEMEIPYEIRWARDLPKIVKALEKRHADDQFGTFLEKVKAHPMDDDLRERVYDLGIRAVLGDEYDS